MATEARIIAEIPLASGHGRRAVAIDEAGTVHIFTDESGPEQRPDNSFTAAEAVQLATDVLAGKERTVTASWSARILAGAVLALAEGRS